MRRRGRFMRVGLVMAAIAVLSGCAVGPNYARPPVITPEAYKELDGWKVAEPGDLTLRGTWWETFSDPTLNELENRVSAANQTLVAAEATYRQATALVREARAGFFPTVTIGAGYTRSQVSSTLTSSGSNANATAGALTGGVSNTTGRPTNFFQLPIDVSWTPDFWGRVRRTVESNQAAAQASAGDLETARLSLQAELAQDYFQLRTLDAQRKLLDETVAAFEQSLELTRTRYRGGVASQVDVVQAETQLETTRAQAIDVGVQRAQFEHAIAVLTGQPASTFSVPTAPLATPPPAVPVGVPSQLLERRPDIAAAERRMASANAQIGVALAAYYPMITLSASTGFESSSITQLFTWPSRFFSVGPSITQTVIDGGLRRAQTDQARAAYDTSVANYRQTVLTAFQGVEDNLAALRILESEADVQERAVKAAQRSVSLTTSQYRAGTVSYLNVITTQTIALADEVTAVQILGRRMTATILLVQALGGGWNAGELPSAAAVTERTTKR
jgi:NodT family efflux transporter outer membrane factor (OMF) lipoprotein